MSAPEDNPAEEEWNPSEEEWDEMERQKERAVIFTNCNACGTKLHTEDEEKMGMCERCAYDWQK
jgi:hypothetical protein